MMQRDVTLTLVRHYLERRMFVFARFLVILSLSVQDLPNPSDHFVPPSQADAAAMEDFHLGCFDSLIVYVCA
jgi:hypothetical protein